MKKVILVLYIFFTVAKLCKAQDFYDVSTIQSINLHITQPNWNKILDSLYANNKDARLIIKSVNINGLDFDSVGIKYKGNSSYNPNNLKNPITIKLDAVKSKQNYKGVDLIKLSNGFKDPTMVREVMSYEFARNYMPASMANYVKVYVNDQYHGLYSNIESPDNSFLQNFFFVKNNPFFKCDPSMNQINPPGCPNGGGATFVYTNDDTLCYKKFYEIESKYGWTDLVKAAKLLNNTPAQAFKSFNVDQIIWMLSFNNLLVNLDSYTGSGHNYYAYQDNNLRFNPFLWDLNECFGVFGNAGPSGQLNLQQKQQMDLFLNSNSNMHPFISKLLSVPQYRKSYMAHFRTLFKEIVQTGEYQSRAIELQAIIDQAVKDDPNKLYSYLDFKNNIQFSAGGGPGGSTPGLTELIEPRKIFIQSNAEFQKTPPEISKVQILNVAPKAGDKILVTAKITNANLQKLRYRFKKSELFVEIDLKDDGINGDVVAGDGVFTGSILTNIPGTIEYYIYSENTEAAKFSPERAEFEYYNIDVKAAFSIPKGALVINEILASNTIGQKDQNEELDDWIEIRNTTSNAIKLAGVYLSDSPKNLLKWPFPDTSIAAKGYLIVWADENGSQKGLHANFKLSKNGESVSIANLNKTIIDTLTFGQQQDDISFGLCANEIGNRGFMIPSFSSSNILCTTSIADLIGEKLKLFPVPVKDKLLVLLPQNESSKFNRLEIRNLVGQLVYFQNGPLLAEINIDVIGFQTGFYVLTIKGTNGETISAKFLKQE